MAQNLPRQPWQGPGNTQRGAPSANFWPPHVLHPATAPASLTEAAQLWGLAAHRIDRHGRAIAGIEAKLRDNAATDEPWTEAVSGMKGSLTRLSAELGRQGDALLTVQASLTASSEDTARAAQQVHDSLNGVSASLNGNIARAQNLEAAVLGDGGVKHGVQALHDLLAEVRDVLVDARLADGMQTKLETLACDVAAGREVAHESLCVLRNLHADIGRLYESHIEFRRAATRAERDDFGVARMIDDMARSTQNIREATRGLRNAVTGGEALRAAVGELSGKLAAVPAATTAYVARRAPRPASGHASWAKPATHTRAEESRHAASRVEENATHERSGHRAKGSVRARELKAKVGSVIVRSKQGPPPGGERKGSDGGMRRRSQRLMGRAGARGRRMADA